MSKKVERLSELEEIVFKIVFIMICVLGVIAFWMLFVVF